MKLKYIGMMAMASVLTLGMSGALMAAEIIYTVTPSSPTSDGDVIPVRIAPDLGGGNQSCATVGKARWGNAKSYLCSSDRVNYNDGSFDKTFGDITGNSNEIGDCARNDISVTVTEGTYVAFTTNPDGVGAAIVKGGNDANVYVYDPQAISDSGLASPLNASGDPAGLSNLTFCWNPIDQGGNECFADETAWAAGSRYVSRGNWATYTSYSGAAMSATLWAGQTMYAGDVALSAPSSDVVKITVTLADGWRFALVPVGENEDKSPIYDNNLKVQDYASKPSGNPVPGLFQWKKVCNGSVCEIKVPRNKFYGVHADLERAVECPTP